MRAFIRIIFFVLKVKLILISLNTRIDKKENEKARSFQFFQIAICKMRIFRN